MLYYKITTKMSMVLLSNLANVQEFYKVTIMFWKEVLS